MKEDERWLSRAAEVAMKKRHAGQKVRVVSSG
jgi:hypothetical protein